MPYLRVTTPKQYSAMTQIIGIHNHSLITIESLNVWALQVYANNFCSATYVS